MANLITSCGINSIATGFPQGSHMIADGTNYWIFYGSSTQPGKFCYRYSSNTSTWSGETTITATNFPTDARQFAVIFNSNNLSLLVAWWDSTNSRINYLRGTISGTSISWSSLIVASYNVYLAVNVIGGLTSSSVPYLLYNYPGANYLFSSIATNALTSSFSDPDTSWARLNLGAGYDQPSIPIGFHLGSDKILAISINHTISNISALYSIYTPLSWSAPTFIVGGSSLGASLVQWGASYISSTNIALVGVVNTNTFAFYIYNGSSFNSQTAPVWPIHGLASNSSIMLSNDSVNYNLFVIDGSGYLEVNSWNGSSWSGWSILSGDVADTSRNYIQEGTYAASATDILYTHTNGSNYEIWITQESSAPSLLSSSGSFIESADFHVNYYYNTYSHNLSPSGSLMSEGRGSDFLVNPIFKPSTSLFPSFIERTDFLVNSIFYKFVSSFFQPTSISGCFAWYPSTSVGLGNIPSGVVTLWQDLSGSGNDLHSISSPEYYSNRINGYPSIVFNSGLNNSLKTTLFPNPSVETQNKNLTVFTVFRTNDPIGKQVLHSIDKAGGNPAVFGVGGAYSIYNNASGWFYVYNGAGEFGINANVVYTSGLNLDTEWYIRSDGFDSAGNFFMRRNGTTIFSQSDVISGTNQLYLNVGFANQQNGYFNGEIAEIIYYSRSLNSGELISVEQYLAQKYNIPGNNTFPLFLFADTSYINSEIPLYTYNYTPPPTGTNYFPLYIGSSQLFSGILPLFVSGFYSSNSFIPLYTTAPLFDSSGITLFTKTNELYNNSFPLFVENTYFINPTGFAIPYPFPLYVQAPPVGTGTNYNYIPLTVGNYVQLATANPPRVKMFISGEGTLVGGSIESSTMPLFLERQAIEGNSFPLYIQSNLTSSGIPLMLQSANIMPGTGVLLYISGLGASGGFPCYLAGTQFLGSGIDMFVEGLPTLTSNVDLFSHGF